MHHFDVKSSNYRKENKMVIDLLFIFQFILILNLCFVFIYYSCNQFVTESLIGLQSANGFDGTATGNDSMNNNNMEVIFLGQHHSNNNQTSTAGNRDAASGSRISNKFSSCKTLQRKLELKVERAKKNFSQQNGSDAINVIFVSFLLLAKHYSYYIWRLKCLICFLFLSLRHCRTQRVTMHRWYQSIDFQFQAILFHLLNTNPITGNISIFLVFIHLNSFVLNF